MSDECLCEANAVVMLPCSGGSHCGQVANAAAVQLTYEGLGNMYRLAGIGAHVAGMLGSTRSAQRVLVIDGCSVACGKKAVEHVGLAVTDYIDVTAAGVEKNHQYDFDAAHIAAVVNRARSLLQEAPRAEGSAGRCWRSP